jgi:hypothetical protein
LTIALTSGITVASLGKTSLPPFQLLTISGTGFNPQGIISVTFSDSLGFSLAVPPVYVLANRIVVGVPTYINPSTGDFSTGTVSVQVSQSLGSVTSTSNVLPSFLIQDLPTASHAAGTLTLDFLNREKQFLTALQTEIVGHPNLATPEMKAALAVEATGLDALVSQVSAVIQNPAASFALTGSITVGSGDLAKSDRLLLGMLAATASATYGQGQVDPEGCLAPESAQYSIDGTSGPTPANGLQLNQMVFGSYSCAQAESVQTTLNTVGGVMATVVAVGATVGAPPVAVAAGAAGVTVFSAGSLVGLTAVGGYIAQGTQAGQALVQGAAHQFERFIETPLVHLVEHFIPEDLHLLYHLAHLLIEANETTHAITEAAPLNGGPTPGSTNTLTVSTSGPGSGNTVSFPGGVVCGSDSTACVVPYPTGTTVYLDPQPDTGSTVTSQTAPCSGTGICPVVMNGNQSVSTTFDGTPSETWVGSFTGTEGAIVSPGVWNVDYQVSFTFPGSIAAVLSSSSVAQILGNGHASSTETVAIQVPPPTPNASTYEQALLLQGGTINEPVHVDANSAALTSSLPLLRFGGSFPRGGFAPAGLQPDCIEYIEYQNGVLVGNHTECYNDDGLGLWITSVSQTVITGYFRSLFGGAGTFMLTKQ